MAGRFRLATFNIENLDWSPSAQDEFGRRLAVLRPQLAAIDADILCLQEVDAQRETAHAPRRFVALDRLVEGGGYERFFRAATLRPGGDAPADIHNLAILSRWPIVERRQLYHDIVAPWRWTPPAEKGASAQPIDVAFDRPILYARIALAEGASLHVLNLHLRAPRAVPLLGQADRKSSRAVAEGQWLAAQKREGQALEARLFVDRLFDEEREPLIAVCGDFNSEAYDAPARILWGADDPSGPRGLAPLATRVDERARFTVVHAGRKTLIDQLLASPALAARCAEVAILNDGLADEATAPDPILGSLHAPLVATFRA
ncbi:hypothetical+protein [Methylocapsa aurea]|uniref:endonuclease/exonuclease/phosphatase family protein n=1 Tax=Methylocapsa aurea TaxID=663610 RepID=UPI003D18F7A6